MSNPPIVSLWKERVISFLKISFLIFSVIFFSAVPNISKFFLLFLLSFIFIFLIIWQKGKHFLISKGLFFFILTFFGYLLFNTYFVSKIIFDSKSELINYELYILTFLTFLLAGNENIEKELSISFLIVQTILLFLFLNKKEEAIYFFVYNPNILAGYCLTVWLFSFCYILEKNKYKHITVINLLFSTIFLLISKSFSSIFVLLIILIFKYSKKYFLNIIFLLGLLIFGIVYNYSGFYDRLVWIWIALKVWIKNFLFGVGVGNFKFYYQEYAKGLQPSISTIFVHNYFLHISTELGFIGFCFISFIVYFIMKNFSQKNKKFVLPLIGFILQNLVDYNLVIPQNSILFFVLLSAVLLNKQKEIKKNFTKPVVLIFITLLFFHNFVVSSRLQEIDSLLKSSGRNDLKRIVTIDKTCWYGWKKLAFLEFVDKDFATAKGFFCNTIKYNPRDPESYLYLALINFKSNNKTEGYKFFLKAVILNPNASKKYKNFIMSML